MERNLPCSRLDSGLRDYCDGIGLHKPLKLSPYPSNKVVLLFYYSCIHCNSTLNFFQDCFLCIHNVSNWFKVPSFQHGLLTKCNHFWLLNSSEGCAVILPFTPTLRGHYKEINWHDFNTVFS